MRTLQTHDLARVTGGRKDDDDDSDQHARLLVWERRHPFQAQLCQGSVRCAKDGGFDADR